MYAARNTAKAIVVAGNRILMNKNIIDTIHRDIHQESVYYDLPGGGQERYESLEEAVVRECLEETGYSVKADKLLCVYEEIYMNSKYRERFAKYAHRVYFFYACHLLSSYPRSPTNKDKDIISTEWIDLDRISSIPFHPRSLCGKLKDLISDNRFIYLGTEYIQ